MDGKGKQCSAGLGSQSLSNDSILVNGKENAHTSKTTQSFGKNDGHEKRSVLGTNESNKLIKKPAFEAKHAKNDVCEENLSLRERILASRKKFVGSIEPVARPIFTLDQKSGKLVYHESTFSPGLFKIFDGLLLEQNDPNTDELQVVIKAETNEISIKNSGKSIPIEMNKDHKCYIPTLLVGHPLSESDLDDEHEDTKSTGGRSAYSLMNAFSTEFTIECVDTDNELKFRQVFRDNMSVAEEPVIKKCTAKEFKQGDYTKISFAPDLARFNMTSLDDDIVALFSKRVYDITGIMGSRDGKAPMVKLNGSKVPIKSRKDYLALYDVPQVMHEVPSVIDGLTPVKRFILNHLLTTETGGYGEVADLLRVVKKESVCKLDDESLMHNILDLAHSDIGSNNLNLLSRSSRFGTRRMEGERIQYKYSRLETSTSAVFPQDKDIRYSSDLAMPEFTALLPVLPLVLVNGATANANLLNFHPQAIIRNIRNLIAEEEVEKMVPHYEGFRGTITETGPGTFAIAGIITRTSDTTLRITEIPIGTSIVNFKLFLESMTEADGVETEPEIKDFQENHTDTTVAFTVNATKKNIDKFEKEDEGLLGKFKLVQIVSTSNMTLFDPEGHIVKYTSPEAVLEAFFAARLSHYEQHKPLLLKRLSREQKVLSNKARFVEEVCSGNFTVDGRERAEILSDLKDGGYDVIETDGDNEEESGYSYLLSLSSLTQELATSLRDELEEVDDEISYVKDNPPSRIWLDDLDDVEEALVCRDVEKELPLLFSSEGIPLCALEVRRKIRQDEIQKKMEAEGLVEAVAGFKAASNKPLVVRGKVKQKNPAKIPARRAPSLRLAQMQKLNYAEKEQRRLAVGRVKQNNPLPEAVVNQLHEALSPTSHAVFQWEASPNSERTPPPLPSSSPVEPTLTRAEMSPPLPSSSPMEPTLTRAEMSPPRPSSSPVEPTLTRGDGDVEGDVSVGGEDAVSKIANNPLYRPYGKRTGRFQKVPEQWEMRYAELVNYKKEHSHCDVPQRYGGGLGKWCDNQRTQYKYFCSGSKTSSLTVERIKRLNDIGFKWFVENRRRRRRR